MFYDIGARTKDEVDITKPYTADTSTTRVHSTATAVTGPPPKKKVVKNTDLHPPGGKLPLPHTPGSLNVLGTPDTIGITSTAHRVPVHGPKSSRTLRPRFAPN